MNARASVALVGLRCSGKTSVGARLAALLELPFVDLDRELAQIHAEERLGRAAGVPLEAGALLTALGEPDFRALESRALERVLASGAPLVLATGGGTVESARNRELLAATCRVVWLDGEPELLRRRLAADSTARPALTAAGALAEIEALAVRRAPLYAGLAELRVATLEREVDALAHEIVRSLGR